MHRVVQHAVFGDLAFGDVGERAHHPDDLAIGAHHWPRLQREPEVVPVPVPQAEVEMDAPAPLFQHRIEAGAVAVAIKGMQHVEPAGSGAIKRSGAHAQRLFRLVADVDVIGHHIPVEDDVARARQGQGLALDVGDRALHDAPARKGVLHDREADQHDDQHQPAHQRRGDQIVGEIAGHREGGGADPGQQKEPGGDQHHRAVDAMQRQIDHEDEAHHRDSRQRNARDARRHRRIINRDARQDRQQRQPADHHMGGAHMPAAEIEIGEEEDRERRGQKGLRAGAPDLVARAAAAQDPLPEAEVDADIDQHRPAERRGGGEDHGALHHEDDGEEQGQQAGDADDDALVEGEAGHLVLVGVRLPQIELGQVGRAQLRHIGDGGAGIEGQAEDVRVRALLALGRKALAGGDGGDAGGAKVRRDDARAHQPEIGGDNQSFDLLFGVVGEGEDDPVGLGARLARTHFDSAHDAVRARRGGDLEAVALRIIALEGVGKVDGLGVQRHAHGFHGSRRQGGAQQRQESEEKTLDAAHGYLNVSFSPAAWGHV